MIYISDYLNRWKFITLSCIVGLFISVTLFLFSHLMILYGATKEKADKDCVSPATMNNWENIMIITNESIEGSRYTVEEFKIQCEARIEKAEEERDKYLGWYNYQKNNCKKED